MFKVTAQLKRSKNGARERVVKNKIHDTKGSQDPCVSLTTEAPSTSLCRIVLSRSVVSDSSRPHGL